jgi:M6 family metalloprotease-like protein
MERNYFKRIASAFLSVMLVLTSVSIAPAAQVSDTVQTQSVSTRKYANIVVFVDFKDTTHEHEKTELGKCYKEDPKITEYFEGDEEHPRALKQYVSNISYGQLNVQNIIPQYDSENNKIEPYVLSNDVSYYGDRTVGTSGPALGDTRMVKEISELLAKDSRFPKDAIVDYDGDGCVDNLMIVTACEKGNSNSQMYGHKSTYAGTDEINSKKIGSYTVIPEGLAYFGLSETGVVIHEFMHTLGYPDLYVNTNVSGVVPVGQWDIMAMVSKFLQYPLAYFRSAYSGWFDIPTVTESKKNCSIYAASSTTFDTRNNQAVILRTDYSSNEFFVVEYRKQKAKYDVASYDDKSYEGKIYGSGLIIYRINASLIGGNMYGPPYKAYVFRPGDSILNGYEKADYTNLDKSFLSAESGRTSYGTHDKNAGIADNAITYSDGTNSGIVIENVGSASGDTITFDISFADDGQEGRWITESTDTLGLSLSDIETYTDSEQNKYFIANIGDGYGYATNDTVLFKYSDGAWSKITDGPKAIYDGKSIVTYNGDVYISYLDTNCYARVDKWNGSSWQNIYKASGYSDNVSLVAGSEGIYFSYTSQDNSNIYAYKYDGNTLKNLSDNILAGAVSSMPANAAISVDADENIFVEYRDTANNIKKYNQIDNSWNAVLNGSIQANEVVLSNNNGKLYLFKKGTAFDTVKDSYLYSLDYANSAKEWTQVGTNSITDKGVNNASLCFDGDNVYVGTTASDNITFVSGLVDGEWQQLGTNVSIQDISGLNISYGNSKIYATYLDSDTGKAVVRSYEVKSADKPEQPVEVPITEVQLGREALDMYEGDTFKLTATVLPVNTTDSKDISWSSNNEAVATVSEDGTVTAKSVGTALITATSTNGKTASCTVTVEKKLIPITEVSLSESAVGIIEGNTHKLTATVLPENTTDSKSVSWSSNNEAVATVSEDGTITAKSAGTAIITATSSNGKTADCTVTVSKKEIPITEVHLDKSSATLTEGDSTTLVATVLPENTTDGKSIKWSSSNVAVATVDLMGKVTAKSAGTAIITATSENGKTASCAITVEKKLIPITEVSLSESAVGIIEGNTHKLTATVLPENTTDSKSVSWSSNNEAVATVSKDGTITAKSAGTAVITATSTNGKTAGCTVTVSKKEIPIVDVALNRTSATITEGDILNLTATVLPENTTESKNIGWSSSNNDIATVDSTGKVTAKQAGTVVITATSSNGKTASCTITVEKKEIPITEVVLNKTSAAVDEGETIKLIATVYPENTTNGKSIKWNSNNNTVVTVDLMGNVTAKKAGTAIITATSENGVSASCTITVNKRDTYTGLRDVNGELTYFNNGNVDTTYTGLVDYEDSTYYVRNGVVDITYTGFADYEDDRYYISEGVVDTEYTGLVQDGDDWLYVENGKVNSDYTGLTYYNDVWFYITNGKINWGYTGLVYYNDIWFYVSGGMIDWNYAGLVYYNDVWFYVSGGMIGWDYTGLAYFADTWFYISNGMLDWNYLGLTYYNDMWFVISGGTINWSYMGLVYYNDIWFYVSGGTINWDYEGLIYYRDTWFYVSGGCVDWTTAVIEYNGNKFYIQDGMVDWNFSGTIDYKGYTYHIVGGMVV